MADSFFGNCLRSLINGHAFIAGCTVLFVTAFPIAQITLGAVYMHECPAAPFIPVYVMVFGMLALLLMSVSILPKRLCPTVAGNIIWTLLILGLLLFVFIWFIYGSYQIYSVYPPNYVKVPTEPHSNNSVYMPTALDNKTELPLQIQNQSLSNFNQTWVIMNVTLALSNNTQKTSRGHLNTPQSHSVMTAVHYCNRTVYLFAFWTTTMAYVFVGNALVIAICVYGSTTFLKLATAYLS